MSMDYSLSDDDQNTYNFLLGISEGWEQAGDDLLDKCAEAYRDSYDDKAALLRTTGELFKRRSVIKRQELDDWQKERATPP